MKAFYAVAAAVLSLAAFANGSSCSQEEQNLAFTNMISLLGDASLSECASQSGFDMTKATAPPSEETKRTMCTVQQCNDLIRKVKATNPPDCDLLIPTSNIRFNVNVLVREYSNTCGLNFPESRSTDVKTKSYNFRSV
ncbi:putative elicitin [Plasmopara halstedii]